MIKPPKNEDVKVWHPSLNRFARGKWTGRRWIIFNDFFGGYDPANFEVEEWQPLKKD